jgi:hypothetical protein
MVPAEPGADPGSHPPPCGWGGFLQRLRTAIGSDIEEQEGKRKGSRLARVIPPLIGGVAPDGFDQQAPEHQIPPGHGGGLRRHGHNGVHEIRMRRAPKPGQHAPHGNADHEAHMAAPRAFSPSEGQSLTQSMVEISGNRSDPSGPPWAEPFPNVIPPQSYCV